MQVEPPEGLPEDIGEGSETRGTWWPWPEAPDDEGAPTAEAGGDETLSLPFEELPAERPAAAVTQWAPGEAPATEWAPGEAPATEWAPGEAPVTEWAPESLPVLVEPAPAPEPLPEVPPAAAVLPDEPAPEEPPAAAVLPDEPAPEVPPAAAVLPDEPAPEELLAAVDPGPVPDFVAEEPAPAVDAASLPDFLREEPAPAVDVAPVLDAVDPSDAMPGGSLPAEVVAVGAALAVAGTEEQPQPPAEAPGPVNEAIPAVPPQAGTGPIGSIPAAQARTVWSRLHASNWRLFLVRFLSAGLAVVVTVVIVPGLGFAGWRWGEFTRIAVIFGLLNATVKPLLQFLVLRFIFSTYGIVVVVINTLLLVLLGAILDDTFSVYRPVALVLGGAVVGILGLVFETLLGATPPVLDRDYKERNGLR